MIKIFKFLFLSLSLVLSFSFVPLYAEDGIEPTSISPTVCPTMSSTVQGLWNLAYNTYANDDSIILFRTNNRIYVYTGVSNYNNLSFSYTSAFRYFTDGSIENYGVGTENVLSHGDEFKVMWNPFDKTTEWHYCSCYPQLNGCNVTPDNFSVNTGVSPSGYGSVTGGGVFESGSTTKLTATPNNGYQFVSWNINGQEYTSNPFNLIVTSDTVAIANFKVISTPPNISPPSDDLDFTTDTTLSTQLEQGSSTYISGGKINVYRYDYYNLYTVSKNTLENNLIDINNQEFYFEYVTSGEYVGEYIFPVYQYSKLLVYAPNMTVSNTNPSYFFNENDNYKFSYVNSTGVIQRDVSLFEFEYVSKGMREMSGWEKLPFSNDEENRNLLTYIGEYQQVVSQGGFGMSATWTADRFPGTSETFYFSITDSQSTINSINIQIQQNTEQKVNQQLAQQGNELISSGNSNSQQVGAYISNSNDALNSVINEYNSLESQFKGEFDSSLNAIDTTLTIDSNFLSSVGWVSSQFTRLISGTPLYWLITVVLTFGVALLLIGKRGGD